MFTPWGWANVQRVGHLIAQNHSAIAYTVYYHLWFMDYAARTLAMALSLQYHFSSTTVYCVRTTGEVQVDAFYTRIGPGKRDHVKRNRLWSK